MSFDCSRLNGNGTSTTFMSYGFKMDRGGKCDRPRAGALKRATNVSDRLRHPQPSMAVGGIKLPLFAALSLSSYKFNVLRAAVGVKFRGVPRRELALTSAAQHIRAPSNLRRACPAAIS